MFAIFVIFEVALFEVLSEEGLELPELHLVHDLERWFFALNFRLPFLLLRSLLVAFAFLGLFSFLRILGMFRFFLDFLARLSNVDSRL